MRGLPAAAPPFPVTSPYRVVPGPRPLGDLPHVVLDDRYPAALARRLERLATDPGGIAVRDPADRDDDGLGAALRAAWALLPLPRVGAEIAVPLLGAVVDLAAGTARRAGRGTISAPATEELLRRRGLDLLVTGWQLACSDDLVILRRRGSGVLTAELLAVAFPSGWPPRERAGASLLELHAPVADGERLQRAAPALSEALLTKGPYLQHVWGLDPDGRLDRDPSAPDRAQGRPAPAPREWFLRVERQTSRAGADRAAFVISPFLVPLCALPADRRRTLAAAVASMTEETARYKGIAGMRGELVEWLQLSPGSAG